MTGQESTADWKPASEVAVTEYLPPAPSEEETAARRAANGRSVRRMSVAAAAVTGVAVLAMAMRAAGRSDALTHQLWFRVVLGVMAVLLVAAVIAVPAVLVGDSRRRRRAAALPLGPGDLWVSERGVYRGPWDRARGLLGCDSFERKGHLAPAAHLKVTTVGVEIVSGPGTGGAHAGISWSALVSVDLHRDPVDPSASHDSVELRTVDDRYARFEGPRLSALLNQLGALGAEVHHLAGPGAPVDRL